MRTANEIVTNINLLRYVIINAINFSIQLKTLSCENEMKNKFLTYF